MDWKKGNRYQGKWLKNKMHGRGLYIRADKGSYDGYWLNGMRHGRSVACPLSIHSNVTTFSPVCMCKFVWSASLCSGIETEPDGEKFVGRYARNKRHGRGSVKNM